MDTAFDVHQFDAEHFVHAISDETFYPLEVFFASSFYAYRRLEEYFLLCIVMILRYTTGLLHFGFDAFSFVLSFFVASGLLWRRFGKREGVMWLTASRFTFPFCRRKWR